MSTSASLPHPRDRSARRQNFIQRHYPNHPCTFLAGDASPRQYYRLGTPPDSLVVMDAPLTEKPEQFVRIAELLRQHGLCAPAILHADLNDGFLIISDFGDATYSKSLTPENTGNLYTLAIDTLIALHQRLTDQPEWLDEYTQAELLREALLFMDWYYPQYNNNKAASDAVREEFVDAWQAAFVTTLGGPCSLVLRDYHVDNLMILPNQTGINQCGLLDFQDALWGSVTYDIVSLLEDARCDVDAQLASQLWHRYGSVFPQHDLEELKRIGTILSAARHTKIIGIFTRLAVRDGKNHYLQHLPRLWRLLANCLQHPDLKGVKAWFDCYQPGWQHG